MGRRILITNDDGIGAYGIRKLAEIASKFGEVTVVSPDSQRSAASHHCIFSRPLVLKEYDYNASSWSEQPESVQRTTAEVLGRFAAKVREVRSQYLGEGWVADDSLAFSYLMAHAERCGYGWWREEDDAL